jgi:hypothetical protein
VVLQKVLVFSTLGRISGSEQERKRKNIFLRKPRWRRYFGGYGKAKRKK